MSLYNYEYDTDFSNFTPLSEKLLKREKELEKKLRKRDQGKEKNDQKRILNQCLLCKSDHLFTEIDGYIVCKGCGLVSRQIISDEPEWNNYTKNDGTFTNNSRCGKDTSNDINPFINQLSTYVPKGSKSTVIKDNVLIKSDISRFHIQQSYNHLQKSFNDVQTIIDTNTVNNYSPIIVTTAKKLWGEVMKSKKIVRAGPRKGLITCCLYYACIHHNCPKSPQEISRDFGFNDVKNFNKGDREFNKIFENNEKWSHLLTKDITTVHYFGQFCSKLEADKIIKLGSSFYLTKKCMSLHEELNDKLVSVFPKNAACAIIFYICKKQGYHVTKTTLSKSLGICAPTLGKTVKIINDITKD